MKKYKIAAIIMMIHGIIEAGGFFSLLPIWLFDMEPLAFIPDDFLPTADVAIAGLIWGAFRIISAIGLLKGFKWGLAISVIGCAKALAMMMTLLPFGIIDGILAGTALILILTQYFGKKKIMESQSDVN